MAIRGVFLSENNSIRIKHSGGIIERVMSQFTTIKASKAIVAEIKAELQNGELVFYHKNRSGTIAIAIGAAPKVWPEDEELLEVEVVK